jgi:hypothetical protein
MSKPVDLVRSTNVKSRSMGNFPKLVVDTPWEYLIVDLIRLILSKAKINQR